MHKKLLILLTKTPEAGKVKSRLGLEIGAEKAAEVYSKLLSHTLQQMKLCSAPTRIALEGDSDLFHEKFGNWDVVPQVGADLGARMHHAFENAFSENYSSVVLIGGDCPEISSEILDSAFERLHNSDLVLGPSQDGGYYLIGLKKVEPSLFDKMQWSTERVLEETIARAEKQNMRISLLPTLRDLDDFADLNAFPSFAP